MKKKIWHFSKKTTIWIYRFFEAAIAFFLVLFFLAFWKLYTEPMDAKFLLPAISQELLPKNSGYTLEVQSAQLNAEFKEDGLFHLNMRNLQLIRPDKTVVIDLPHVDLSYGFWHIITLNYMPDKLIIANPDIHVVIDADGNWGLQPNQEKATPTLETVKTHKHTLTIRQLLNHILSLNNLTISNGIVTVEDLEKKEKLSLPQFNLFVRRRYGGLRHSAKVSAVAQIGQHLTDIKVSATYSRLTKNLTLEAGITPLYMAKFARFMPLLSGIDFPMAISLAATFNTRQKYHHFLECLEKMKFQVKTVSAGHLTLPSPIAAIYPIQSAEINGAISAGFKTIKIAKSQVVLANAATGDLEVTVKGLDQFIRHTKIEDIQTTLNARVHNIPMTDVPKVWPREQGSAAHTWVVEHLSQGYVPQADFHLTFTGSEMTDVFGDIQTEGVRVDYLPDMPPLENVQAHVLLYPNKVEIVGEKGQAGLVQLINAKLLFAPLDADITDLDIQLDLEGPISEMLHAINQQPLTLLKNVDFDWNQIQGDAQTRVQLKFPLDENTLVQQLKVEVSANTDNAGVKLKNLPLNLDKGKLNLFVNNDHLDLQGNIAFQTQPISVAWHEDFSPGDQIGTNLDIKGSVITESFKTLFPDAEEYASGIVAFDATLQRPKEQLFWQGSMKANFDEASLNLYPIAVTKNTQEQALMDIILKQASMNFSEGSLSFDLDGTAQKEPLVIQGQIDWGQDWAIVLENVKAAGNNFSAHLKAKEEMLTLNVQGDRWDLSKLTKMPLLRGSASEQQTKTTWLPHMLLEAQLNTLVLNPQKPLENIIINAERKENFWKYLQIEASTPKQLILVYNPQKRLFEGGTEDVGELLSALNLSDRLLGGQLKIKATQETSGLIQGKLSADKTEWTDPGFLTQALSILGIVDAIRGKNMVFDEIQLPFELKPEGDLNLTDGYAAGSNLGITLKGSINLDHLDIAGSVIPAYLLNSLPGKIPLIGALFREGEGGGLLGIKYSIKGKPSNAEIEFHPLSSMAPGALGYIF